jgi:general secretion pathway protein B
MPVAAKGTPVTPVSAPSPAKTEAVKAADDAAARLTIQELGKRQLGRRLTPEQTIAPPADIVLSGIAWQDERLARRAVVNGFLMQEGGIVSGARIVEIHQDRVRFGMSGKYFDLYLVSATAPAPGK